MEKIKLGNSDIKVTPLAFGAWAIGGWMWGGADRKDALDALDAAVYNGISSIDTAPVYGFGLSEEIVGKAIKGKRSEVEILTKYGMQWENEAGDFFFESVHNDGHPLRIHRYSAKEQVIKECESSLKRLGTDYIDLYQIHWPDPTTPISETMEAIEKLLDQGKIRAAGVSNYSVEELSEARQSTNVVSNQVPYSMVKRDIEEDLVPYCLDNNVGILAYSPLQRGLLTGKITPDYIFNEGDSRPNLPHFSQINIKRVNDFLAKIRPIAEAHSATIGQLVTKWTIMQPGISVALVGARNRVQVEENALAAQLKLTTEEIAVINSHLEKLDLVF